MKKDVSNVITWATTLITTIGVCTWLGYKFGHMTLGIILGFLFAMMYLFAQVFKK